MMQTKDISGSQQSRMLEDAATQLRCICAMVSALGIDTGELLQTAQRLDEKAAVAAGWVAQEEASVEWLQEQLKTSKKAGVAETKESEEKAGVVETKDQLTRQAEAGLLARWEHPGARAATAFESEEDADGSEGAEGEETRHALDHNDMWVIRYLLTCVCTSKDLEESRPSGTTPMGVRMSVNKLCHEGFIKPADVSERNHRGRGLEWTLTEKGRSAAAQFGAGRE